MAVVWAGGGCAAEGELRWVGVMSGGVGNIEEGRALPPSG